MNFTTVLKFNLVFHALKPISAVVSHFNSHLAPAGVVILHPPTKVLSCCLIRPSWIEVYSARIIENTSVVLLYSIYQRFGYCQWKACIENTIFQNINKRLHTFGSKMDTFFFYLYILHWIERLIIMWKGYQSHWESMAYFTALCRFLWLWSHCWMWQQI